MEISNTVHRGKYVKYVKVDQSCLVVKRWFHDCLAPFENEMADGYRCDIAAINIIIPDRWQNNRGQTRAPGARVRLTPDTLMNIQLLDKKKPPPLFPRIGKCQFKSNRMLRRFARPRSPWIFSLSSFSPSFSSLFSPVFPSFPIFLSLFSSYPPLSLPPRFLRRPFITRRILSCCSRFYEE